MLQDSNIMFSAGEMHVRIKIISYKATLSHRVYMNPAQLIRGVYS